MVLVLTKFAPNSSSFVVSSEFPSEFPSDFPSDASSSPSGSPTDMPSEFPSEFPTIVSFEFCVICLSGPLFVVMTEAKKRRTIIVLYKFDHIFDCSFYSLSLCLHSYEQPYETEMSPLDFFLCVRL